MTNDNISCDRIRTQTPLSNITERKHAKLVFHVLILIQVKSALKKIAYRVPPLIKILYLFLEYKCRTNEVLVANSNKCKNKNSPFRFKFINFRFLFIIPGDTALNAEDEISNINISDVSKYHESKE